MYVSCHTSLLSRCPFKMWRGGMRLITATRVGLPSTAPAALAVLPQWALGLSSLALQRAASTAPASSAAPAQPYFITEAPAEAEEPAKRKWGKSTIRSIRGHTKKLNPVARQVRCRIAGDFGHSFSAGMQRSQRTDRVVNAVRGADFRVGRQRGSGVDGVLTTETRS